jgi:hypothetical protein
MKKIGILAFVLALVLVLPACSLTKTAITAEDFSVKATALGFTVQSATDQMDGQTVNSLLAIDSTRSFQVEFHEVSTQSQASGAFLQNRSTFEGIGSGTTSSSSGSNWARYTKTAGGAFHFVSYIDNTFVYVRAPQENRQAIQDFVKELGY